jgi:hypothetical protein
MTPFRKPVRGDQSIQLPRMEKPVGLPGLIADQAKLSRTWETEGSVRLSRELRGLWRLSEQPTPC